MADSEHRIYESDIEAGNQGSSYKAWRAFCSCGWVGARTADRKRYEREVAEHLEAANA